MDKDLDIIIKQIDIICKDTGIAETEEFKKLLRSRVSDDGTSRESLESLLQKVKRLDSRVALEYGLQLSKIVRPTSNRKCHKCGREIQKESYCLTGTQLIETRSGNNRMARIWFHEGCAQMAYEAARVYQMEMREAEEMAYEPDIEDF